MEAIIFDAGTASVDARPVTASGAQNIYQLVLDQVAVRAASEGEPVSLTAHDHVQGTTDQMLVTADGQVTLLHAPAAAPRQAPRPPTSPTPQAPSPEVPGGFPAPHSPTATDFTSFIRPTKPVPSKGWRRTVHSLTGGAINPGLSATERRHDQLIEQAQTRATKPYTIAVMCLKGGIGKTSTTVGVGLTLAQHRGDRVIAIDANPDAGDLYERTCPGEAPATLTDLADRLDDITGMTDLSRYTSIAGRLTVLAGDQEPTISESLSAEDFTSALRTLQHYFNVILVDCGTGVTHPSMVGILSNADQVVIAGGYAVSGAKRAERTLRWLATNGYERLARNAVVVLTATAEVSRQVNTDAIEQLLGSLAATVVTVPRDQAVADGAAVTLDRLDEATRQAYLQISAAVAEDFR
ncbi:MinD-like ATPase involved in chromosome partitioning or flagellar assembly [Antricoccus suffuscus]|uniref:MinD-like ATPase involved in chromosome partitioning or flagellar assembly n=1 Tax=Antricoccus suffuscus TaxID=1629062 RepID=A0A2T0ZTT0_9ACTN|nr:MinD/ParA family protein [Antricoccus suffuscus]PRZ39667.1 MinD-like ATPase involved in chromosome partitioning or flagellar assembly [Antricoccus suffuscus]